MKIKTIFVLTLLLGCKVEPEVVSKEYAPQNIHKCSTQIVVHRDQTYYCLDDSETFSFRMFHKPGNNWKVIYISE